MPGDFKETTFIHTHDLSGGPESRTPILESTGTSGGPATELLSDASGRLRILGIVAASIWAFYFIFGTVIRPVTLGLAPCLPDPEIHYLCLAGFILSLVMYILARSGRFRPKRLMEIGLLYVVLTALLIASLNLALHLPTVEEMTGGRRAGVSWICIWILVFPLIVPTSPRKTLLAAIISAVMDPVVYMVFARATGLEMPSIAITLIWWLDNYICAFLAVIPAHIVGQLGEKVKRARQMGSYQLVERIGKGGMGEVWKANHNMLARPAAIKIIRPDTLGEADRETARLTLRRFEREAQATAALESPHSIQLYDFGLSRDGTFYFVMELLEGFELDELVRRYGPLPPERALFILKQVCHSLSDAHNNGLVHRDVKPANIFICRKGEDFDFVKVLDFGLVKSTTMGGGESVGETMQGIATGTPAFMAPEQVTGDGAPDRKADIYALGCVAYWLLTGELLFRADSAMKMVLKHVQEKPEPPSTRSEFDIPEPLDRLILQCLEKDPNQRPESARELGRRLDDCALRDEWNEKRAAAWWQTHSPEMT